MIGEQLPWLRDALDLGSKSVHLGPMLLRAVIVFFFALTALRLGEKRLMGAQTALDVLLVISLGAILGSAVTMPDSFFEKLIAVIVLIALHWAVAALSFYFPALGRLVKGRKVLLLQRGQIQWDGMRAGRISEEDLRAGLRSALNADDFGQVERAYLERNGDISAVKRS